MKKVLNFQPATTTSFGIFRIQTTSYFLTCCFFILIFLMSNNLNAQSNQDRDAIPDLLSEILVYPNPVTGGEHIRMMQVPPNAVIEIVTIDGEPLWKFEPNPEQTDVSWDLTTPKGNTVAPGIYFVFVTIEDGGSRVFKLSVIE